MKWINIILSIYLLVLASMPCADAQIDKSHSHAAKEQQTDSQNPTKDKHTDSCSPFCICNCCGIQILNYTPVTVFEFNKAMPIIAIPLPAYTSVLNSNFFGSIWQPPQIV